MRLLPPCNNAQRETLGSTRYQRAPVSEIGDLQGVDRRVPFILRPLQGKLKLLGAAHAVPHQDQAAKPTTFEEARRNRVRRRHWH
jgi:hypothetical protein